MLSNITFLSVTIRQIKINKAVNTNSVFENFMLVWYILFSYVEFKGLEGFRGIGALRSWSEPKILSWAGKWTQKEKVATYITNFRFASKADQGVHTFSLYWWQILEYHTNNFIQILNWLFINIIFLAYFSITCDHVCRKRKENMDTLIDFFVLRRVRVYTKKWVKADTFLRVTSLN